VGVPIRNGSRQILGALAPGTALTQMSDAIANIRPGQTGFAFLVDDAGKIIDHGRPSQLTETPQDLSKHP
jgi:hypothetical protein